MVLAGFSNVLCVLAGPLYAPSAFCNWGVGAFCKTQETNAEGDIRGRKRKLFIIIFSLLLSCVLHLSPSLCEMYPSARFAYKKCLS